MNCHRLSLIVLLKVRQTLIGVPGNSAGCRVDARKMCGHDGEENEKAQLYTPTALSPGKTFEANCDRHAVWIL
jgi:hypothetical protein